MGKHKTDEELLTFIATTEKEANTKLRTLEKRIKSEDYKRSINHPNSPPPDQTAYARAIAKISENELLLLRSYQNGKNTESRNKKKSAPKTLPNPSKAVAKARRRNRILRMKQKKVQKEIIVNSNSAARTPQRSTRAGSATVNKPKKGIPIRALLN